LKAYRGSGATTGTVTGVKSEEFRLSLRGASNCSPKGDAAKLTVDCSGASHAHALGLNSKSVKATVSGASTAEVHATEELSADASGASTIRYAGAPAKLQKNATAASSISPKS
jgi:hypothetical protein